jgi:hypothetical protein
MALLSMITRRRRAAVVRPQVATPVVAADPAPEESEPAVEPVRTNPYAGLELALTVGAARLRFMRGLR